MKRSDEILLRASNENRGLTKSERGELREAYLFEQSQSGKFKDRLEKSEKAYGQEDRCNLPRHTALHHCGSAFEECPLCYKCRNYNPTYEKCRQCDLPKQGKLCNKQLHTSQVLHMMIVRPKVNIDGQC